MIVNNEENFPPRMRVTGVGVENFKKTECQAAIEAAIFFVCANIISCFVGVFSLALFDDEIYTLSAIESFSLIEIVVKFSSGTDVHPFLSYALFKVIAMLLGGSEGILRFFAFQLSVSASYLFYAMVRPAMPGGVKFSVIAGLCFLTVPLLYGVGDSLRWWPLFSLLTAIFLRSYAANGHPTRGAAAALGLAASTNVLAFIPYLSFALHRYGLRRQGFVRADLLFHCIFFILAAPAAINLMLLIPALPSHTNFASNGFIELAKLVLAVGGGNRLGPAYGALVVPYWLALGGSFLFVQRLRRDGRFRDHLPVERLLDLTKVMAFITVAFVMATGFGLPRSFVFLTGGLCRNRCSGDDIGSLW
jgi:hypothetical protein